MLVPADSRPADTRQAAHTALSPTPTRSALFLCSDKHSMDFQFHSFNNELVTRRL